MVRERHEITVKLKSSSPSHPHCGWPFQRPFQISDSVQCRPFWIQSSSHNSVQSDSTLETSLDPSSKLCLLAQSSMTSVIVIVIVFHKVNRLECQQSKVAEFLQQRQKSRRLNKSAFQCDGVEFIEH